MDVLNLIVYLALCLVLFAIVIVGLWRERLPFASMIGLLFLAIASIAEVQISFGRLTEMFQPRLAVDNYHVIRFVFGLGAALTCIHKLRVEIKKRLAMKEPESEIASFNETLKMKKKMSESLHSSSSF